MCDIAVFLEHQSAFPVLLMSIVIVCCSQKDPLMQSMLIWAMAGRFCSSPANAKLNESDPRSFSPKPFFQFVVNFKPSGFEQEWNNIKQYRIDSGKSKSIEYRHIFLKVTKPAVVF